MESTFLNHIRQEASRSPRYAIMLALMLYLGSKLVLLPLLGLLISIGFQLDATALQSILSGEAPRSGKTLAVLWTMQGGNQLLTWGLVAWLMASLMGSGRETLAWRKPDKASHWGMALLLILLALPLAQGLTMRPESLHLPHWLADTEARMRAQEVTSQRMLLGLLDHRSPGILLGNLVAMALLPAICEEAFFRGFLQRQLARWWSAVPAVLLTAVIFSAVHFQVYGFFSRAMLGTLLGLLVWRSGSLGPPILAHFIYNAASVVATYYLATREALSPESFARGYGFGFGTIIGLSFLLGVAIWLYIRLIPSPKPDQESILYEK